jgi:hypothetical protein
MPLKVIVPAPAEPLKTFRWTPEGMVADENGTFVSRNYLEVLTLVARMSGNAIAALEAGNADAAEQLRRLRQIVPQLPLQL